MRLLKRRRCISFDHAVAALMVLGLVLMLVRMWLLMMMLVHTAKGAQCAPGAQHVRHAGRVALRGDGGEAKQGRGGRRTRSRSISSIANASTHQ
jgi:hypothetical protein